MMHVREVTSVCPTGSDLGKRANLMQALEARLLALYSRCQEFQATYAIVELREGHPVLVEWDAIIRKSELTRKALIRVREGMSHWKWRDNRAAELAAVGKRFESRLRRD